MDHAPRRRDVLICTAVAVLLRALWVAFAHRPPAGLSDPLLYQSFAENIAAGRGYSTFTGHPTAYYPPGYPFTLAALTYLTPALGGSLPLAAGLFQSLLGGVSAAAAVVAGARVGGARAGRAAGLLIACWPSLILYTSVLLSESLFVACFSVFAAAVLTAAQREDAMSARVTAAAALGAAMLVRSQVILAVPAVATAWLLARRGWKPSLRIAGVLAAGVVLALTPWTIRNAVVLHAFVPLATNGGDNMCIGFHPGATGDFHLTAYCETGPNYIHGVSAELERDRQTSARARQWALANLGALPALSLRKLHVTYRNDTGGLAAAEAYGADPFLPAPLRAALTWLCNVYYAAAMVLAATGALLALQATRDSERRLEMWLLLALTAAAAVVPLLVFGDPRFKTAAVPCYALLASLAVAQWRQRQEARA